MNLEPPGKEEGDAVVLSIHKVKESLGEEVASALCEKFGGQTLYIPKKQTSLMFESEEDKNRYIFNLCTKGGVKYEDAAERFGMSTDRIMKIVSDFIRNKER